MGIVPGSTTTMIPVTSWCSSSRAVVMTGTMSRASLSSPYISETTTSSLLEVKAALKRERRGRRGRRERREREKRRWREREGEREEREKGRGREEGGERKGRGRRRGEKGEEVSQTIVYRLTFVRHPVASIYSQPADHFMYLQFTYSILSTSILLQDIHDSLSELG